MNITFPIRIALLIALLFTAGALHDSTAHEVSPGPTPTPEASPSPTPTPDSETVQRLKEEKAQSELRKGIAEDQKAEREARFPKPTATPLEGKTEVDSGVKLESEMLAYRSLKNAADRMVVDMVKDVSSISAMAVHSDHDLKALLGYMVLTAQLNLLRDEYLRNITASPPPIQAERLGTTRFDPVTGIAAAQSILGGFIDLVALLRTDTTVTGMEFNIEESALVSQLFRAVRGNAAYGPGTTLLYPAVFPPRIGVDTRFLILGRIEQLHLLNARAADLIAEIETTAKAIAEAEATIGALENKLNANAEQIPVLDNELERLQKIYWKWPSPRIAERIEEVTGQIEALRDENKKIPAAIQQTQTKLESLGQRLVELYGEILPEAPPGMVRTAVDVAINKIINAETLLGRPFTEAELYLLFAGFSDAKKKALIAEAEKYKGRKLTDEEKTHLVSPLNGAERRALKKISDVQSGAGVSVSSAVLNGLAQAQKLGPLTQADRTLLLSDPVQAALRKQKDASLAKLKALDEQFEKLKAELIKVDAGAGISAITSYLQAENLLRALGCDLEEGKELPSGCTKSYIVQLKVVRAGGNNKTTKNLLKDIFTEPSLSHSGGVIVQYNLYDITGQSKSSNIYTIYSSYKNAKEIPNLVNEK